MIPYGKQDIQEDDIAAVIKVLQSEFLTQGPEVPAFEALVAKVVGADYSIALNSATSALHVACMALDLGSGDTLWTSPVTFVASANCARYCGAEVDFVDVEPSTGNMCVEKLERKLVKSEKSGRLPKILVPVHLAGNSCDMERIGNLAKYYGVRVIEDASHAIGGSYKNSPVGACNHSDITVFSFHPVKIVTSAEGGVAVTNDSALARRMGRLRSHGITRETSEMTQALDGPWFYQQLELGWNYRMTDIHAALGRVQMNRLQDYVERRNVLAAHYDTMLKDLNVKLPALTQDTKSAFHLYIIRVAAKRRRAVFEGLITRGIGVNCHYIPVHMHPYYRKLGFALGDFPEAEKFYSEAISIPIFPTMTENMQNEVKEALFAEIF